jgi:hypothetical protein
MKDALEALGVGLVAQSSLLIAGVIVCWLTIPHKLVGVLAGFGAGAMIAAISFDLLSLKPAVSAPGSSRSACSSVSCSSWPATAR